MSDHVRIRREGKAGRITLARPKALNALDQGMADAIEAALVDFARDDAVRIVVIDAEGERAFCAGGDIAAIYRLARAGDFDTPRRYWRHEYQLNQMLAAYPKPTVSLMQGFTMGGGVGLGCHLRNRVVGDSSELAMPEASIGMIPDVGGTLLLSRAPGRIGEYLAVTGARMGPGDAVHAGFADYYLPEEEWPNLIGWMEDDGLETSPGSAAEPEPLGRLKGRQAMIDRCFAGETIGDVLRALEAEDKDEAAPILEAMHRNAPLSMACGMELVRRVRGATHISQALEMEYRFVHRVLEHGDMIEGVRALIIDKDKQPRWRHATPDAVTREDIERMLAPLGPDTLRLPDPAAG